MIRVFKLIRSSAFYRGAVGVFGINGLGAALAFALNIIIARVLGVSGYGYYVYALTVVSLLGLVAMLGFDSSLVRLIAEYRSTARWSLLKGALRFSSILVTVSLGIVVAVLLVLISSFGDSIEPEARDAALPAVVLLVVFCYLRLTTAGLRALELAARGQAAEVIVRHVVMIALIASVVRFSPDQIFASTALWLNVMATFMTLCIAVFWLRSNWPHVPSVVKCEIQTSKWTFVSLSLLLIAGAHSLLRETDVVMIGLFMTPDSVGVYGAASNLSRLVTFGLVSANAIAAPMIASLYHTGQIEKLQLLLISSAMWSTMVAIAISAPLILGSAWLLTMFGPDFQSGRLPLHVLLLGNISSALAGSVGFLMAMTGHHRQAARILLVTVIVNFLLNVGLIPAFGIVGAAVATAVSKLCLNLALIVYAIKEMGLNPTFFSRSEST